MQQSHLGVKCVKGSSSSVRKDARYSEYVALSDTSEKAFEVYFRRLKAMTASERLELGAALWTAGDSLQRAALWRDDLYADEAEITFRIAVSRFGLELSRKAYGRL